MPQTKLERLFAALGLLAIVGLIAAIVPAWLHYRDAIAADTARSTRPEPAVAHTMSGVTTEAAATTTTTAEAKEGPLATSTKRPTDRPLRILIAAARGDCWLEVHALTATGKLLYVGVLTEGKTLSLSGQKLWIRFGAGENVDLTLDGKPSEDVPTGAANVLVTSRGVSSPPS